MIRSTLAASTLVMVLIKASNVSCCPPPKSLFLKNRLLVLFEDGNVPLEDGRGVSS
jgi:hypothetical protein